MVVSTTAKSATQAGLQVRTYLASLPADVRRHLQKLREAIRAAAPGAVESFGYGMPAFRLDGKPFVWYAAWKHHSSLFPLSEATARPRGRAQRLRDLGEGDGSISTRRTATIGACPETRKGTYR